ncbi:hypothetical protein [Acidovorax sp.]|uniref:hypothetical protein n=1 Tax=Acidovorax sp. TaxID=1872122 RepID=UPI0025BC28DB|nr:hypothetical protein [Acidovorax sp.]MBL7089939.1 hypothetical protein [Acidovorax sp.]
MSKTDYTWLATAPHKPDVYVTRINTSKIRTVRYWDGQRWFDISLSGTTSRGSGTPFTWPKRARVAIGWRKKYPLSLRKITNQAAIQWGTPYRVYDDKEVLAYLVKSGRLPADWRTAFQDEMRAKLDSA